MKILFPFLLALMLVACNDDTVNSNSQTPDGLLPNPFAGDTASYRPVFYHRRLPANLIDAPQTPLGAYGKNLEPNTGDPIVSQLLDGFWVFEFYHDGAANIPQRKLGKGQWFRFAPDGTFTAGHWQDWTHTGTWIFQRDGEHNYLTIDSNIDRQDAQWDIQALSTDLQDMGWVRTNNWGFQKSGRQVHGKMQRLFAAPTKEQYGVEE